MSAEPVLVAYGATGVVIWLFALALIALDKDHPVDTDDNTATTLIGMLVLLIVLWPYLLYDYAKENRP